MAQQSTQSSGPEILIIRSGWSSFYGDGLCEHLQSKGRSVVELGPIDASPEKRATKKNIEEYLIDWNNPRYVRKLVVFFGHGATTCAWDTYMNEWITTHNCESLTNDLHVFMLSCATAAPCRWEGVNDCPDYENYGLGRRAVEHGRCYSWYGFTYGIEEAEPKLNTPLDKEVYSTIRRGLWTYVDALVDGKTVEEAADSFQKGLRKAGDELEALKANATETSRKTIETIKKRTIDDYLDKRRLYKHRNGLRLDRDYRTGTGVTSILTPNEPPPPKGGDVPKEVLDVITPPSCRARPALIQSDFGTSGNFEVLLWEAAPLRHYWRDNDLPNLPWHQSPLFGENVASAPALIQSSFGAPHGNFEVVVREGSRLRHYYRDNNASGVPWRQGVLFGDHVDSAPALIQSSFGAPHGNFEVVVREGMQLRHYWRDNNAPNLPWWPGGLFGKTIQSAASLVQAKLGGTGNNFHVAAIEFIAGEYLAYNFCRDTSPGGDGSWACTQPIGMVGKWIVSSRPV